MVIAVIAILAALLLPAIDRARSKAKQTRCIANLNQIGVAFNSFAHDHDDKFPISVPVANGGVLEYATAGYPVPEFQLVYRIFRALSNDLAAPQVLVCPSQGGIRFPSLTFTTLTNDNISYFVGLNAIPYNSDSFLSGDSGIDAGGLRVTVSAETRARLVATYAHVSRWNILFADAHVESLLLGQLAERASLPQTLLQPAPPTPGPGGGGGVTAGGGGGNSGSGGAGVVGSGVGAGASGGRSGAARGGSGGGASGFSALERFFQPKGSPPSSGAGGEPPSAPAVSPVVASTPLTLQDPEVMTLVPTNAPTNRVTVEIKPPPLVQTQAVEVARAVEASNTVPAGSPPIDNAAKESRDWLFYLLLAIVAAVLIGVAIQRRKRRQRAEVDDAPSPAPGWRKR